AIVLPYILMATVMAQFRNRVASKLKNEVDSVLGDRYPIIQDMKDLKYIGRVINELYSCDYSP
ncbi:hypothetical protein Dimus_005392, partial [Dionaea muscipula]